MKKCMHRLIGVRFNNQAVPLHCSCAPNAPDQGEGPILSSLTGTQPGFCCLLQMWVKGQELKSPLMCHGAIIGRKDREVCTRGWRVLSL